MAVVSLTGPSVEPASGGPARQLVVFLHGVGADGNDLIELAPYFAQALPDAAFVSPNAPFPYDMAPVGHQWFSLADRSMPAVEAGVRAAAPILDDFLDDALARRGLSEDRLALVGFSQGTMMALHTALRRPRRCACLLGFSGMLAAAAALPEEIRSRPPVLLIHGAEDELLPAQALPMAAEALAAVGVPVLTELRPGLGHGIDQEGLRLGVAFVAQNLLQPQ